VIAGRPAARGAVEEHVDHSEPIAGHQFRPGPADGMSGAADVGAQDEVHHRGRAIHRPLDGCFDHLRGNRHMQVGPSQFRTHRRDQFRGLAYVVQPADGLTEEMGILGCQTRPGPFQARGHCVEHLVIDDGHLSIARCFDRALVSLQCLAQLGKPDKPQPLVRSLVASQYSGQRLGIRLGGIQLSGQLVAEQILAPFAPVFAVARKSLFQAPQAPGKFLLQQSQKIGTRGLKPPFRLITQPGDALRGGDCRS